MAKTTYTLEAIENFVAEHAETANIYTFEGTLLDTYFLTFPSGYKYQYMIIEPEYLSEWSSVYTIKRTNSEKVFKKHLAKYADQVAKEYLPF